MDDRELWNLVRLLKDMGIPVNRETVKACVAGQLNLIAGNIEGIDTGGISASETIRLNTEYFKEHGEILPRNNIRFDVDHLDLSRLEEMLDDGA